MLATVFMFMDVREGNERKVTQRHTETHRVTHRHTQTHTDTHRHTQTHTDAHRHTHRTARPFIGVLHLTNI